MDSSLIASISKSREIILKLMKKQNYNVDEYDNFSINEINSKFINKQLDMLLEKVDPVLPAEKIKIYIRYYLGKSSLRPQNIQDIIDDLFHLSNVLTKKDILMIVVIDPMNDILMQYLKHIWEQDQIFIIVQSMKSLQYNILEHEYVPDHRILSAIDVAKIKQLYNITNDSQFPEISRYDPVAQVIGIRPGQICEITRPSKTAISSKYYRICI